MKRGQQMTPKYKIIFSNFVIEFIFKKTDTIFQVEVDKLVIRNMELLDLQSTYGFVFDGVNFIHSSVTHNVFQQRDFARSKTHIPHDNILKDAAELLKSKRNNEIDRMHFKGLINGMLSVVKSKLDFQIVFDGMFVNEIRAFDLEYDTDFGRYTSVPDLLSSMLTTSDMLFVQETKEKFKVSYDRYRMLTDVLGF